MGRRVHAPRQAADHHDAAPGRARPRAARRPPARMASPRAIRRSRQPGCARTAARPRVQSTGGGSAMQLEQRRVPRVEPGDRHRSAPPRPMRAARGGSRDAPRLAGDARPLPAPRSASSTCFERRSVGIMLAQLLEDRGARNGRRRASRRRPRSEGPWDPRRRRSARRRPTESAKGPAPRLRRSCGPTPLSLL